MSYISKLKKSLNEHIDNLSEHRSDYCNNPDKDFSRYRKIDFPSVVKAILCFEGKSLNKELYNIFGFSPDTLTPSAFVQQRSKIKPDAFYDLFRNFTKSNQQVKLFHGYRLLAVDGSDIHIPNNTDDADSIQHNSSSFSISFLLTFSCRFFLCAFLSKKHTRSFRKCAFSSPSVPYLNDIGHQRPFF